MSDEKKSLEPCPFCGGDVYSDDMLLLANHGKSKEYYAVACACGAVGPQKDAREEAISGWNIRRKSVRNLLWNPFGLSIRFAKKTNSVNFKGHLNSLSLSTLLQSLSSDNKTGIMQLECAEKQSAICFKGGEIIAAQSTTGRRLGEMLLDECLITPQQLQKAVEIIKKSERSIGEVLLSLGYINQESLQEVIDQQVLETVLDIFRWKEGHFEYRDCQVNFDPRGAQGVNIFKITLEVARVLDEQGQSGQREYKREVNIVAL